jgi:hypothetical protein
LGSQLETARKAFEETDTKLFFQAANAMADRALGQMQLTRGLGKAQVPSGHDKNAQSIE